MKVHPISQQVLRRTRRLGVALTLLPLGIVPGVLLLSYLDHPRSFSFDASLFLCMEAALAVESAVLAALFVRYYRSMAKASVSVTQEGIARTWGGSSEIVDPREASAIEIWSGRGRPIVVKLKRGSFRDRSYAGLEDMDSFIAELRAAFGTSVPFRERRPRLGNRSTWLVALAVVVLPFAFFIYEGRAWDPVLNGFLVIGWISLGVYVLLFQPNRRRTGSRTLDALIGVGWLVGGIVWLLKAL